MPSDNLLLVADSVRNADMLHAAGVFVPDPFIWFTHRGRRHVVVSDLEFDRVRAEASQCKTLSYSRYERRLEKSIRDQVITLGDVLCQVLREHRIKKVTVSESFPLGLAKALRDEGFRVKLKNGPFFPDRAWKSADEIKKISAAVVMAEVGLAEGFHALHRARPDKRRRLMLNQAPLTADRLRGIIDTAILQAGGHATHTIVACGRQASDPHERGHGHLLADQPIVLDVFPRSQRTGYHGDVTRTVVRGRATDFVRGLYAAVLSAQETALRTATHGTPAADVHRAADRIFRQLGFKTSRRNGHMEGFFHGVGHGIGLEVHEGPRISHRSRETLRTGHVIAVEPGLYYPDVGGVRLEDVVLITRGAPRNLTKVEKRLEI